MYERCREIPDLRREVILTQLPPDSAYNKLYVSTDILQYPAAEKENNRSVMQLHIHDIAEQTNAILVRMASRLHWTSQGIHGHLCRKIPIAYCYTAGSGSTILQ
jgi:hypothetical protein